MQRGLSDDLYKHVQEYHHVEAFSEPEKLAIEYAERFALDHPNIDEAFFARLREHFSDKEILELTTTIGFCMGLGRVLSVLQIANDCELNLTKEPASVAGP